MKPADYVSVLNDLSVRSEEPGELEEACHFNRQLVKFNFAVAGDPPDLDPEFWNMINDPPDEYRSVH